MVSGYSTSTSLQLVNGGSTNPRVLGCHKFIREIFYFLALCDCNLMPLESIIIP